MTTKPSKTAQKRESQALQALGERLVGLSEARLDALPLEEPLRNAVLEARRIASRGAQRRQRQLIGKLMRQTDVAPIRAALAAIDRRHAADTRLLHEAEAWRDRLLADGLPALEELAALTGTDTGPLAGHLAALSQRPAATRARHLRREIFRHVHAALGAGKPDGAAGS